MLSQDGQQAKTALLGNRPIRAEINLSAVEANTRAVVALVGPNCGVIAVVKANGYGLGASQIGEAALAGGAKMLAVACVDEGVALRRAGYAGPLLVMSYAAPHECLSAVQNSLTLTLHRAETAHALQAAAATLAVPPGSVSVHIKVDTGLGRYGCLPHEVLPLAQTILTSTGLHLEGLMTHFAEADALDLAFAREQLHRFTLVLNSATEAGITFSMVHAANSAAALFLPESRFNMVRTGILLSGNTPTPSRSLPIPIQRTLTLTTQLVRVYPVSLGDTVGYGRTWSPPAPGLVGLIPVGYADGYSRLLSNTASVLVRGRRCRVAGRISMDQCAVDLSAVPDAVEGDRVVLIGKSGEEEITEAELAHLCGTISYEILCGLSRRVPRHYIRSGKEVEVCDLLGCAEQS